MHKRVLATTVVLVLAGCGNGSNPERNNAGMPETARAACDRLVGLEIPAATIGLPTNGADVVSATWIGETGHGVEHTPAHCRVDASIRPVDPSAPDIEMRLALPGEWSGKTLMFGGGGYNGTIPNLTGHVPYGAVDEPTPLGRGYATYGSDSGHQSTNPDEPTVDGSFGTNEEARRNFNGDALKKTRDTATFVIGQYYTATPELALFAGGSSGGREALAVAQRWPVDFDGVISVYPGWKAASLNLWFGYGAAVMSQPGAFIQPDAQRALYDRVMETCDPLDGLEDGVISDEAGCTFDPRAMLCPTVAEGPDCLTESQIRAIEALDAPLEWNYELGSGETGIPGVPFLSGANPTTERIGLGTQPPGHPMPSDAAFGFRFWEQWIRYFVTGDPEQDSLAVDPVNPGRWQQVISDRAGEQDVNDADLSAFRSAGGKLLIVHGTADEIATHRASVEYYERLQQTMGAGNVADFARLYLVPGANHGNRDAAFAASWDSIQAIEDWTMLGTPPMNQVVTDANPDADQRTRPLCEYPSWPRYSGHGDQNAAASFACVTS